MTKVNWDWVVTYFCRLLGFICNEYRVTPGNICKPGGGTRAIAAARNALVSRMRREIGWKWVGRSMSYGSPKDSSYSVSTTDLAALMGMNRSAITMIIRREKKRREQE